MGLSHTRTRNYTYMYNIYTRTRTHSGVLMCACVSVRCPYPVRAFECETREVAPPLPPPPLLHHRTCPRPDRSRPKPPDAAAASPRIRLLPHAAAYRDGGGTQWTGAESAGKSWQLNFRVLFRLQLADPTNRPRVSCTRVHTLLYHAHAYFAVYTRYNSTIWYIIPSAGKA